MKLDETNEEILFSEQAAGHELAVAEVTELMDRHQNRVPYVFEYRGKKVSVTFVHACLETTYHPANAYRLQLAVSPDILVIGECQIIDSNGRHVDGFAFTIRSQLENSIIIRTLAKNPRTGKMPISLKKGAPHKV